MPEQGRAGGGAQFPADGAAVDGHATEDVGRGRSGHRQDAVGTADLPAAHVDGGAEHLPHPQPMHQQADAHHVGHRVHGPHLVEVDLLHRAAVGVALRLGDQAVDRLRVGAHLLGQVHVAQQVADLPHTGVVVMMRVSVVMGVIMSVVVVMMVFVVMVMRMVVVVAVAVLMFVLVAVVVMVMDVDGCRAGIHIAADLLLAVNRHRHMGAGDAALHRRLGGHLHAGQAQAVHLVQKSRLVVHKLQQGGHKHIAGGPHAAVQIQCFHSFLPPMWLIILAR